jgi:hypothetical protein
MKSEKNELLLNVDIDLFKPIIFLKETKQIKKDFYCYTDTVLSSSLIEDGMSYVF